MSKIAAQIRDDAIIDEVVHEIQNRCHKAALELALDVGHIVITRLFGSIESWKNNTNRELSLRHLAQRPDLPISAASLHRALAVYELWQQLPIEESEMLRNRIGLTHVRAVLGLPLETQRTLLSRAYDESWTTEKIESESSRRRRTLRGARGRRPLPIIIKAARRIRRVAITEEERLKDANNSLVTAQERREVQLTIETLRRTLETLETHIEDIKDRRPQDN